LSHLEGWGTRNLLGSTFAGEQRTEADNSSGLAGAAGAMGELVGGDLVLVAVMVVDLAVGDFVGEGVLNGPFGLVVSGGI